MPWRSSGALQRTPAPLTGPSSSHAWSRRTLSGIVPERTLGIKGLEAGFLGVRLWYTVGPSFPNLRVEASQLGGELVAALQEWTYEVTDDCGTLYEYRGGAHGLNEGVRTVSPGS